MLTAIVIIVIDTMALSHLASASLLPPLSLAHQAQNPLVFYSSNTLSTSQHQDLFPPHEISLPMLVTWSSPPNPSCLS